MADKFLRMGSSEDVLIYDDADFDCALETDAPIKAGIPVDSNDVARLGDLGTTGWSGHFTNGDGNTVTVVDGLITNVS